MNDVDTLLRAGVLGPVDGHLAGWLVRAGGDGVVALAGALASRAVREGHVCVDLAATTGPVLDEEGEPTGVAWPDWASLGASPLVTDGGGSVAPLVLEGDRLYLQRYHDHEVALAAGLVARAAEVAVDAERLDRCIDLCFPERSDADADQRRACRVAAARRLAVICGGPGTGKTTTVARLLAVLSDQRAARGLATRVRLLAPTGKAAARMAEALGREVASLPEGLRAGLPDVASTVHRALSPIRGSQTHYRRGPRSPLPEDVVVVDEASMVDLATMRRLVEAVRPDAHLVLLGDPDQLASVESGAVLGEIARGAADAPDHPVARGVVTLQHSFRFDRRGGIGGLAHAIRTGDAPAALEVLAEGGQARWLDRPPMGRLGAALDASVRRGFATLCQAPEPATAVAALDAYRVLCAHRRGPWGVERWNSLIERSLADASLLVPTPGYYPRRPVLVTANDYRLELFNGDQGLTLPGERGLRVMFPQGQGLRSVTPSRLADGVTVFALSVHKSQGSEFQRVVVVLPEPGSPLLTRELLYTAITRARQGVEVVGDPDALVQAIGTPVRRSSGLRDRLFAAVSPEPAAS